MNFETITGQGLRSLTGAALLALGMDQVSCRLNDLLWRILNEMVSAVFWGALSSLQASEARILGDHLHFLVCPLEVASFVRPLLHLLGAAL